MILDDSASMRIEESLWENSREQATLLLLRGGSLNQNCRKFRDKVLLAFPYSDIRNMVPLAGAECKASSCQRLGPDEGKIGLSSGRAELLLVPVPHQRAG